MNIYQYSDLLPASGNRQLGKVLEHLQQGDFRAADVKKLAGTPYYRAKLNDADRLLFRFGRYRGQTCLLILELIPNHAYHKSRFLRGAAVDEARLQPLPEPGKVDAADVQPLVYVPERGNSFHLLDKVLFFDPQQEEVLRLPVPLIIIGSAGSGKTALTLEKIKLLTGTEKSPARVLYVTLSAYLAENASRLYRSFGYENPGQEVDFFSFREFLETISIPAGKEVQFRQFRGWFERHRPYARVKDAHRLFEEFRGVLTGFDTSKPWLSRDDYRGLGARQSIFLAEERDAVYDLFEKYRDFLREENLYDVNLVAYELLDKVAPTYHFIVVDEVQDLTNVQLQLIVNALPKGKAGRQFLLCGDSHQIVHPNFFSWAKVKSLFYGQAGGALKSLHVLRTNYRNSPQVTELANRLLKIKTLGFGSLDRESTYLVEPAANNPGEVVFVRDAPAAKKALNEKIRRSTRFAVLVMRDEDKAEARKDFDTPLLFSVQEAKGLEYENIVLVNFVSKNEKVFREMADGITPADLDGDLTYSRPDREDKSLESYKFFVNALYVAVTRAMRNLYVVESREKHELLALLGLTAFREKVDVQVQASTDEEWRLEARKLELQGKTEQAEAIRKGILAQQEPDWEVLRPGGLAALRQQALHGEQYNKKAKDRLFEYALLYNDAVLVAQLAALRDKQRYAPAHSPVEAERKSLLRKRYPAFVLDHYKEVAVKVKKYGTDYRDEYNLTPLLVTALTGAAKTAAWLLENGADKTATDFLGRTPLQLFLGQLLRSPAQVAGRLETMYALLRTDSLSLRLGEHLIKIGAHKVEYLVANYLMAVQMLLVERKWHAPVHPFPAYVEAEDVERFLEQFPESVVPDFRKDRKYINAMLARNEIDSKQPYNHKLWMRLRNGHYVLNPDLQVAAGEEWVPVYRLMNAEKPAQPAGDPFRDTFWMRLGVMREHQAKAVARKQAQATQNLSS
jgi:hypothetical protein